MTVRTWRVVDRWVRAAAWVVWAGAGVQLLRGSVSLWGAYVVIWPVFQLVGVGRRAAERRALEAGIGPVAPTVAPDAQPDEHGS